MLPALATFGQLSGLHSCEDVKALYASASCCGDKTRYLDDQYAKLDAFPRVDAAFVEDLLFKGSAFVVVNEMHVQTPITPQFATSLSSFDKHVKSISRSLGH